MALCAVAGLLVLIGLLLLFHPKNYSKKGVLRELNTFLEEVNKEMKAEQEKTNSARDAK